LNFQNIQLRDKIFGDSAAIVFLTEAAPLLFPACRREPVFRLAAVAA